MIKLKYVSVPPEALNMITIDVILRVSSIGSLLIHVEIWVGWAYMFKIEDM